MVGSSHLNEAVSKLLIYSSKIQPEHGQVLKWQQLAPLGLAVGPFDPGHSSVNKGGTLYDTLLTLGARSRFIRYCGHSGEIIITKN